MLANIIRNRKKTGIGGGGGGIVIESDPYYGYTSLLLHMDGTNASTTFTDSGPNALAVTAVGNAQVSTSQAKYGGASGSFDGTTGYLTVPDNNVFHFGIGDFTVELWAYFSSSVSGANYAIIGQGTSAFTSNSGWMLLRHSSNKLRFIFSDNGTTSYRICDSTSNFLPSTNTWYHIAATRSGGTVTLFINGVSSGSASLNYSVYDSTLNLSVGADSSGGIPFPGYIDDLRITKGVARYLSTFTPPTQAFPNLYNPNTTLPVSGAALWLDASQQSSLYSDAGFTPVTTSGQSIYQWNDLSGNSRHAIQATLANRPTWLSPSNGQNGLGVITFNGTNQWLDIASFLSLSVGYTICVVVKATASAKSVFSTAGAGTFSSPAVAFFDGTGSAGISQWGQQVISAATAGNYIGMLLKYDGAHTTGNYSVRISQGTSDVTGTMPQTAGTPPAGTAAIGRATNATQYYDQPVCEIIVFPRKITTTEGDSLKSYTAAKWGITWS